MFGLNLQILLVVKSYLHNCISFWLKSKTTAKIQKNIEIQHSPSYIFSKNIVKSVMDYFIVILVKCSFNRVTMKNKDTNYHNIIAQNLKKLRVSSKLSQEKFAEKLNCSREFISRVENFHERLSLNMLLQIAEIFKVNPSSFFKQP